MQAGRNKVLLELAGKPLLLYAVETFRACCDRLLVVSAEADLPVIRELQPEVELASGGSTRHGSEWNALQALRATLEPDDLVAIHDAARPLIAADDVQAVLAAAGSHGAAMLAIPADQPALQLDGTHVARGYAAAAIWRAQTPQAARAPWLLDAYTHAAADAFTGTDTAAVLASYGYAVRVVPATAPNPKVTVPADLPAAEGLLGQRYHARAVRRPITEAEKQEFARRGDAAYDRFVTPKLRESDAGKFVAIDPETGDYEVDDDDMAAIGRLRGRHPEAYMWFRRVGEPAVDRLGSQLADIAS
jgi:2-C-methyl-D-erythritol 4-phosphate cytidylyltransferase